MLYLENTISVLQYSPTANIIIQNNPETFAIVWANPAFLTSADADLEELLGKRIFDVFMSNVQADGQTDVTGLIRELSQTSAFKAPRRVGIQRFIMSKAALTTDKLQLWNCNAYPLLDEQQGVSYLGLTLEDVTEKFSQLSPVKGLIPDTNSEHPLIKDYPDAIFTLDMQGMFLSANRTLLEIAECSFEEIAQLSFIPFMPPEDMEAIMANFKRSISGEILNFDIVIISFKGNRKSVNVTPIPIMSNQDVIGLYIVAKDITAAVKSNQELIHHRKQIEVYNQKMVNILESITDGFYAMDQNWRVTYFNKEAERILQQPRDKVIGQVLWDLYDKEAYKEVFNAFNHAITEHISIHMEAYYEEMAAWIEISAFPSEEGLSVNFKDITARKQIEEKLDEAKIQYQNLFDLSPLPQWVYDTKTFLFKDVNQAAIAQYGYSKAEFLSMSIKELKSKEEVERLEEILQENANNDKFHRTIGRHIKKNGEAIFVQVDAITITFEGDDARLVLAIDITDRLIAKEALIASERKFKALVQDGSDMLAILDEVGNFIYVNQTTTRLLATSEAEFYSKWAFDFVHPDDKERVISEFESLEQKKTHKISPFRFLNGSGQYTWLETVITNMIDDPAVAGVVCNSRDVTNRIAIEQKIKESIERYNIVAKATSDAIWDYDVSSRVVVWNDAVKKLFGYKDNVYPPSWWEEKIHPEDAARVKEQITHLIKKTKNRLYIEYRFRCADGSYKNILDRSYLIFDEQGELKRTIGSMQDITEREMYIRTVEQQNQRLKEIAWTQSHVVRAPLARIMGIADLLSDGGMDEETNEELRTQLAVSAEELDGIIRKIIIKTETVYNENDAITESVQSKL